MVCFRYIIVNTLHKCDNEYDDDDDDDDDDYDDDNNNNNNISCYTTKSVCPYYYVICQFHFAQYSHCDYSTRDRAISNIVKTFSLEMTCRSVLKIRENKMVFVFLQTPQNLTFVDRASCNDSW